MINIIDGVKKYAETERLALICRDETLSYSELDRYSDIIGNYIIAKYSDKVHGKNLSPIAIFGNKNKFIIPCMIAALKSGRAYVPMDISFPVERVKDILESVKPDILFDFSNGDMFFDEEGNLKSEFLGIEVINSEKLEPLLEKNIDSSLSKEISREFWVDDDENSYILFTSGSTGKPKGVQISTYNLDSFVSWISPILGLDGEEKIIMDQPAYSFDLSVSQLYPGIFNGATLHSFPKDVVENFRSLFLEMKRSNMDVWISTPSFIGMCLTDEDFNENLLPNLNKMLFIGEVLPVDTARQIRERFPRVDIINGYGPTEATVGVSQVVITDEHINSSHPLPVGYPMENSTIKIVDEDGVEVADGQKGEIVIIGPSVSKGYYKDEEKTDKAFLKDEDISKRGYKTGDLGYFQDGCLAYCGRKDFQIKLNGFRIEIEDIENNLRQVENVRGAVVLPVEKNEKIAYLKAFLVLKEENNNGSLKNTITIKKELSKLIPEYMIPRSFEFVEAFPLNTNGKIDRKKLLEIGR